jgi:hypothetical protein
MGKSEFRYRVGHGCNGEGVIGAVSPLATCNLVESFWRAILAYVHICLHTYIMSIALYITSNVGRLSFRDSFIEAVACGSVKLAHKELCTHKRWE